jgi:hypothetical protein
MMFTPHQADAVRRALRKGLDQEGPPSQGLDGRLRDALADKGRVRFTADQKDDVRSALRDEKNLRVDLGAALGGPEGRPTTDVDGPAVTEPVTEPKSPKVGATMDGSAHSFQGYGRKVSADGGDPTFCWSL